jgi:hypothetical protein
MASESVFAFKDLAKKFPHETIRILKDKLQQTNRGVLDEHICMALDIIAEEFPELRQDIARILLSNFDGRTTSYGVIESSSRALVQIFQKNRELIPEGFENLLVSYLEYKRAGTITESVQYLLREIKKHI